MREPKQLQQPVVAAFVESDPRESCSSLVH